MRHRHAIAAIAVLALTLAACGDDTGDGGSDATDTSAAETTGDDTATTDTDTGTEEGTVPDDGATTVVAGRPFPEERCAANEAAGTIDYFTGFDYAAAASILEVVLAEESGYFDELCLDVEITPSFSTANYPLVAADEAQFASSGSFSELATQAAANDADLVALSVDGYVAIDVLMVKPDRASSLADLRGQTIGVKGALPPAIAVMLAQEAGLTEGADYQTALLDGFDPLAHWAIEDIAALPGWRSNEPGALERGGETFDLYDPADVGVPGSFGLVYTNREFLTAHPTAAEDFMRATLKALADAIDDPEAAATASFELVEANGNPNFLSEDGETFRWTTDAATIVASTPEGSDIGVPVASELESQIAAYDEVGFFGDEGPPPTDGRFDAELAAGLYADDGTIIWPG
jgi:ABC-type nitrate/sulfonate/bicarbonate transport system substrate-binding protein